MELGKYFHSAFSITQFYAYPEAEDSAKTSIESREKAKISSTELETAISTSISHLETTIKKIVPLIGKMFGSLPKEVPQKEEIQSNIQTIQEQILSIATNFGRLSGEINILRGE